MDTSWDLKVSAQSVDHTEQVVRQIELKKIKINIKENKINSMPFPCHCV